MKNPVGNSISERGLWLGYIMIYIISIVLIIAISCLIVIAIGGV